MRIKMRYLSSFRYDFRQAWLPLCGWTLLASPGLAGACTSIIVTRGASADGAVMITACCDLAGLYGSLEIGPAADHKPGETIAILPRGPMTSDRRARFRRLLTPTRRWAS